MIDISTASMFSCSGGYFHEYHVNRANYVNDKTECSKVSLKYGAELLTMFWLSVLSTLSS